MEKIDPFIEFDNQNLFNGIFIASDEIIVEMYSIPGLISVCPNSYYITSKGRIFSILKFNGARGLQELYPSPNADGYLIIRIMFENGLLYQHRINHLVAYYFVPCLNGDPIKLEVDHKNTNKQDNDYRNLRWVTHKKNMEFANEMGLIKKNLTDDQVKEIIKAIVVDNASTMKLAKQYNVDPAIIVNIKNEETYQIVDSPYRKFLKDKVHHPEKDVDFVEKVYNMCADHPDMSDEKVANALGTTKEKVGRIRMLENQYKDMLPGREPIIKDNRTPSVEDKEALEIWRLTVQEKVPVNKVYDLFKKEGKNYGKFVINEIKFLRGEYYRLRKEYNIEPAIPKINNGIDPDIAIAAYKMLGQKDVSNKDVEEAFGLGESTVTDIKYCRNGFLWMREKGYIPYDPNNKKLNPNLKRKHRGGH